MQLSVKKIGWLMVMGGFLLESCLFVSSSQVETEIDSAKETGQANTSLILTPTPIAETAIIQLTPTETIIFPSPTETNAVLPTKTMVPGSTSNFTPIVDAKLNATTLADLVSVTASGFENAYTFSVEIRSPDTGCEQYADWWEVLTEDGELIYRRLLTHSHVNEQPFTRSGGPVEIGPETVVIIRAHMFPTGYGGTAFRGSVFGHFEEIHLAPNFAADLEEIEPLPEGCTF